MEAKHNDRKAGHYFSTEVDDKWWKRYKKGKMLARGKGFYWYNKNNFYFLRLLTTTPIVIPLKDILEFKRGKWHAGQWGAGKPILKILWTKDDLKLSSGFLIGGDQPEIDILIQKLQSFITGH